MANAPSTDKSDIQLPPLKPLVPSAMAVFESRHCSWSVTVPRTVRREDLCTPSLWAVLSDRLHNFDTVMALNEDRSFVATLLVIEKGRGWANLVELNYNALPALLVTSDGLPPGFSIEYQGVITPEGHGGYCARRVADGVLIVEAATSRDACLAQLLDHGSLK